MEATRAESVISLVFKKLGSNFLVGNDPRPGMALQVVERAKAKFDDGRKYRVVGGMTVNAIRSILNTSPDDDEAANRIINGIMSPGQAVEVRPSNPGVDDLVNAVTDKVMGFINDKLTTAMARAVPQGIQAKVITDNKKIRAKKDEDIALWRERAVTIGIDVLMTKDGKNLDGRWLKRAQKLWDAHVTRNP